MTAIGPVHFGIIPRRPRSDCFPDPLQLGFFGGSFVDAPLFDVAIAADRFRQPGQRRNLFGLQRRDVLIDRRQVIVDQLALGFSLGRASENDVSPMSISAAGFNSGMIADQYSQKSSAAISRRAADRLQRCASGPLRLSGAEA